MKIKYFSQLCEQPHVNQFSHNFKENEHISMKYKKLQISVLLSNFQKTAFYRSGLNEQNEQISVKSADLKK